jgi:hypothetical protein
VATRSSQLIAAHVKRHMSKGMQPPTDELGIAKAYMDLMARMMASQESRQQVLGASLDMLEHTLKPVS